MRIVYLKVNRISDYLLPCVENFVEIFHFQDARIFFICDNPKVQWFIENSIDLRGLNYEFIPSNRDSVELQFIVEKTVVESWYNAAYAHLTTFLHARDNGFADFWNIDADDIRFFAEVEKVRPIFDEVERVANQNHLKIFSLDVWFTTQFGIPWTFGVTYTKNNFDWIGQLINYCKDEKLLKDYDRTIVGGRNIDYFLTYLRMMKLIDGIETWYVDNLRFMHQYPDMYADPLCGIRYCQNGKHYCSILVNELGMGEDGGIPVNDEVYKIDVGLTPEDSYNYLRTRYNVKAYIKKFPVANKFQKMSVNREIQLSIVIHATHDWKKTQECIQSISDQEFYDYELILVAPDDATILAEWFCNRMKHFIPGGIKFVAFEDRENVENLCHGQLIVELDGTEILQPNDLENILRDAEK